MNQEQLFAFILDEQKTQLEIIKKKNCDYGANDDCFANFRMFGELGILVRLGDKLSRLKTIISRGSTEVKDETVEDTIRDLCNYGQLLLAYRKENELQTKI
jgi:hypothetical protein